MENTLSKFSYSDNFTSLSVNSLESPDLRTDLSIQKEGKTSQAA